MITLKKILTNINRLKPFFLPTLFVVGIVLRLYAIFKIPAQSYDIGTYTAWGRILLDKGPAEFFNSTWSDYLPLPIYFCALIFKLTSLIGLKFGVVFKLVVSLIELILLAQVWKLTTSLRKWLLLPFLFLSPVLLGDSAFWGQLDTIPALLTLLTFILINQRKSSNFLASILFGLAVSFKPIMLIASPALLIPFLVKKDFKLLFKFFFISFSLFLLTAVPVVGIKDSFKFLYSKSLEQSSTYPYTTINGWNLWSIQDLHNTWPKDDITVLSLSAHTFGLIVFLFLFLNVLNNWRLHSWDKKYALRIAGTLLIIFYTFTTRMHERHLLFGLPFIALAALSQPWLLLPLSILSLTFTFNLWAAYYWVANQQSWPVSPQFIQISSWLNLIMALTLAFVWDLPSFIAKIKEKLSRNKLLFLILVLASLLRFVNLGNPPDYIFDEVYHAFTAREFLAGHIEAWEWWTTPPKGVAYEWTHPPVAKYGMVGGMLLFGENSFGWRFGSAVFGVISILGIYRLTLSLFKNKKTALIAALLVTIEGLHISQSRIAMNDMYMLCFLIWSLYQASINRWKLAAVLFGLSLGSKWAALYGFVPLFVLYLRTYSGKINFPNTLKFILGGLRLIILSLLIYILTFTPFLTAGHNWEQWWELHRQMWYYHTHLVATHSYQSTPWQWILSLRPVWYYVHYGDTISNIYAQGNPTILWFGLVAVISLLGSILKFEYLFVYISYLIFTVPWIFSPRIMFFYHYLPSATFLSLLLATWLSSMPRRFVILMLTLFALTLIVISPVLFGTPMGKWYWDAIFNLFPSWK